MKELMKLNDLLKSVETKQLVLPDFQRKFVWGQDDMYGLFASILCQMPFGSILTLKSDDDAFSCKKIGAKPRVCSEMVEKGKVVEYLIDGQQRLTSLFAGFSTYYYTSFKEDSKNIATDRLLEMYFLKIPAETNDQDIDIFGARSLLFDGTAKSKYFSSEDMKRVIDSAKLSKILINSKKKFFDINNQEHIDQVCTYCCNNVDGYYRIPLQFIMCQNDNVHVAYEAIVDRVANVFKNRLKKTKSDKSSSDNKKTMWMYKFKKYLSDCLEQLQLDKICVEDSDKARAIDIYSNLNRGGVALNVFDLMMAKVGHISKNNFYDTLIDYIQKKYDYPDILKQNILQVDVPDDYQASKQAEVVDSKNEISREYIDNFLNVLSLFINRKKNGVPYKSDLVKREKILALDAQQIVENAENVCKALDRAFFFFQTRCGVRKLSDINYKAEFAVVAYFFTDDKLFADVRVHNMFEYWYWMSLFAYMYPSNQNNKILDEIPFFEKYFSKFDCKNFPVHFQQFENSVLKIAHYSDKDTLTMVEAENFKKAPPAVMTDYVCQFYMAQGYKDFFSDVDVDYTYVDALEAHHILPLGDCPDLNIGESSKKIRNEKCHVYNSPLNMLYITKPSNRKISNWSFDRYIQNDDVRSVLSTVGCFSSATGSATEIKIFLNTRYEQLKGALEKRIQKLKKTLK